MPVLHDFASCERKENIFFRFSSFYILFIFAFLVGNLKMPVSAKNSCFFLIVESNSLAQFWLEFGLIFADTKLHCEVLCIFNLLTFFLFFWFVEPNSPGYKGWHYPAYRCRLYFGAIFGLIFMSNHNLHRLRLAMSCVPSPARFLLDLLRNICLNFLVKSQRAVLDSVF